VRRFARELGVDLAQVPGTGPAERIRKEDVQAFVQRSLGQAAPGGGPVAGLALPEPPRVDFARFGEIEQRPLSRIQKIAGPGLHRNWLGIPHVTQFDEADITGLEEFRKAQREELAARNVKLTLLAFLTRAVVAVLRQFPQVNASLDPDGEHLILKKYYHIGVAVDTPEGLVVPVIRDADRKGLVEIARELGELASRAREQRLTPEEMQGGTFTISSLGGLGGTGFTPIINAPEAAILGVARATMQPVYRDGGFVPRLILPFSLSYDHRIVDGADAVRFTSTLGADLSDVRRILL
jgi:pyruvate dehydrogenase E2 component (dihydrolipoamide acetyltransferase)